MHDQNGRDKMQWAVIGISGFVLLVTVIAAIFNPQIESASAYFLFGTVCSLVFGAAVFNKIKK